jgi:hypothetical protein
VREEAGEEKGGEEDEGEREVPKGERGGRDQAKKKRRKRPGHFIA